MDELNFMIVVVILIIVVGCVTPPRPEILHSSTLGYKIAVTSELPYNPSPEDLSAIDDAFLWATQHGLEVDPSEVTINFVKPIEFEPGKYGFQDNGGQWVAGLVQETHAPWSILLLQGRLDDLRHEFTHMILFEENLPGNQDHSNPLWKEWGVW